MRESDGRVWYDKTLKGGKFIQAYVKGLPYLKLDVEDSLHGVILMKLLNEHGIPFRLIDDDIHCQSPPLKADDGSYELVGAGLVDGGFAIREGEFVLYGGSKSYSTLKPNQKHLDDLALNLPRGIKFTIDNR
jgi:hypothetical protein